MARSNRFACCRDIGLARFPEVDLSTLAGAPWIQIDSN
jgi:hypothetical protein